jgi:hypothetical protein
MLTGEQVWHVLRRGDLLSGWPILPAGDARCREMAQAWAEQLDATLTFEDAMTAVERHCQTQWRPLTIRDLNAAAQDPPAPPPAAAERRGSGALQRIIAEQANAIPVPPDLDLHRFRHRTPRFLVEARQRATRTQPQPAAAGTDDEPARDSAADGNDPTSDATGT